MSKRIVICRSNPVAPDPRVEKIARLLAKTGYQVTILGWDRTGEMGDGYHSENPGERIQVVRINLPAPFGHGLQNLPNLLRWQRRLLGWLVAHRSQYALIHACDFDTVLPALWCQSRWGIKVVYDVFDFYADHLRATPAFLKRLVRGLDLWAIGRADAVVLADDSRRAQIAGSSPKQTVVIYNSPEDPERLHASLPVAGDGASLKLAYIGLLQVERGLMEMLDVVQAHPEWHLDLAGFGGDEAQICERLANLPNVTFHGRVSYEQALAMSAAADLLFATYDPQIPNHRYSSPNKVFEAMMLGKPVIVARDTNMDRIIEQAGCGLVVQYGDTAELESAVLRLQDDPALRTRLGQNGQAAYRERYSWVMMETRLQDLYFQLIGAPDGI